MSPETISKKMFRSYLIMQSIPATLIITFFYFLCKCPFFFFISFIIYQFFFSITLSSIDSLSSHPIPRSFAFGLFVTTPAFYGFANAILLFGFMDFTINDAGFMDLIRNGLRGFLVGSIFRFHYVCNRRWVLEFPIIQRSDYFNFKKGIPLAAKRAFKLTTVAIIYSAVLLEIIPYPFFKCSIGTRAFFAEQMVFFVSSFALLFLWELTLTIRRVFYTKRPVFAPPKGSAAAETNPSEHLLSALEKSNPTSILRYLAYLDLCMVCENNVDTWRRAAFFEESGETYKRVIAVCLTPLEQLASRLGEDLGNSANKPTNLSNQLSSSTDVKHVEELYDFQPYAWCSRIVASLTACSRKEDKFGVAKRYGCNATVISTLISCLLAVENFMGKKTNLQSPNQSLGSADIKWKAAKSRRSDIAPLATVTGKRKNGPANSKAYAIADVIKTSIYQRVSEFRGGMLAGTKAILLETNGPANSKAYAIADVLKTSIYQIVYAFHDEILAGILLEKDLITSEKPLFGTREMHIEKLRLFLYCRAT